ncbi:hypothetical protein BATDEDRAFT_28087 [Batrachochytrium dendrobatidis JAM81]|uniref:Uncharacterized protein n=2 Tax=Batrachochytrium dendrobatidis TaxID=109871 RepID=F4PCS9_BATDJ|nr:uncharacterized protein BATDEDRAFT_28087 [Batrachochytrium dendrobatidis JAM81]EGF76997.1 hypothetical protein BATDEDRAFT_28087 [Batrachochytrium dendrobatidis JAM81]KAJ8330915.1 hypothetical protein O5D80_000934 [Batrachochytrium dendrobatidis]KAK5672507.1 hypothetical protein QVD99_001267 [Batrachochytrium dendrobatidis]OAJ44928.1 hypothetical protein BDEG_28108 [Batrachochytrium dendrobatidis JEL423]|eukprot:XP_006682401.1 hypothetical protein BATDEDRAFT_28087 [Batrachochytrium dendrobatidis JAM81]
MPSCDRFFEDLAECLMASDCVVKYGKRPQECVEAIMRAKLYDRSISQPETILVDNVIPPPDSYTPSECMLKHQAYQECKVHLMNPRRRFRTPYGGPAPKNDSNVSNDTLGAGAENSPQQY